MTREQALEAIYNPKGPPNDPEKRQAFEAWLERDEELRGIHEEQTALFGALAEWTAEEPSAGFNRAVYARIDASLRPRDRIAEWFRQSFEAALRPRWAAAGALAAALAVTVWVTRGPRPEADRAPKTAVAIAPADEEYFDELDRALDDLEMLVDFEALAPAGPSPAGRS